MITKAEERRRRAEERRRAEAAARAARRAESVRTVASRASCSTRAAAYAVDALSVTGDPIAVMLAKAFQAGRDAARER